MTDPTVVAVDIGGTKIAAARVVSGHILDRREVPTPAQEGPQAVVQAALDLLADWCTDAVAVGVASGGVVHGGRVVLSNPKILPGWTGLDLGEIFRGATGLPVRVLNDAQAAAWGELPVRRRTRAPVRGVRDGLHRDRSRPCHRRAPRDRTHGACRTPGPHAGRSSW